MDHVTLEEAGADLPGLVERAAGGQPFVITRDGRPLVRVTPVEAATTERPRRVGFLAGRFTVPEDFDRMGGAGIERLFDGG
ncbi:type II toxin-antitoxin system Phd/YefM family antitoxin [Methylobacterium sp. A54F]